VGFEWAMCIVERIITSISGLLLCDIIKCGLLTGEGWLVGGVSIIAWHTYVHVVLLSYIMNELKKVYWLGLSVFPLTIESIGNSWRDRANV
jgi:hypothetical protein